jgi:hypothetical protein
MTPYQISWAGGAEKQFNDLLERAAAAGKREEFVQRFGELGRAISDPPQTCHVGRAVAQTDKPGGFYREWQYHFLYVKFAVFPDEGCGWIYHIEFNPPTWA